MTTKLFTKPLDDSNGSIRVNHNAMQLASQTKKTPWHLRFAPGAILRQIGLAILTLTMLVGVQTPEAWSAGITRVITRVYYYPSRVLRPGETRELRADITVYGIDTDYAGWRLTVPYRDQPGTTKDKPGFDAALISINDTLASDLVSAMEKYENDIDAMTAREIARITNCLARNVGVKFPGCTQPALSSWDVHILFAIEELESSVNSAVRRANSAAKALVRSH